MASSLLDVLKSNSLAYAEYLNQLSFDERIEIDLNSNTCANLDHVAGKYHVPLLSGSYEEVFRFSRNMVHPADWADFAALTAPDVMRARLEQSDPPGTASMELRYKLLSGEWSWSKLTIISGPRYGLPEGVVHFFIFDINNRKTRESGKIAYAPGIQDSLDARTRLLRERIFLVQAQKRIDTGLSGWSFLMIDLEHFRLFNDWYGRSTGDLLLAEIGACLAGREERDGALCGYLGQDNFAMLAPYDLDAINALTGELHQLIASHGAALGFLPSVGVRPFEGKPQVLDLLDDASLALREVKRSYQTRVCVFQPEMRGKSEESYRMLLDFQDAIRNGEIFFCLQPQCRISSHRIVGAECLARWRKPNGEMVPPNVFIPVLEQYGFVTDLDTYIWDQVCQWMRRWMDAGHRPIPISVNVSPLDMFSINVPAHFKALSEKYGIPAGMLKVEVTESAYASDAERISQIVSELRREGFAVLMDDFGSGYSSLNMLRDISVDAIKLDARFLQLDAKDSEKGIRIIESVFNMTKTMAIPVIVEGVEAAEQTNYLADLGCRYIQGFHFYRPMPAADFEALAGDDGNMDYSGISFKANEELHVREFMDANNYSDVMLNNILGPVAFYSRVGGNVDIIRFNERFYQLVDAEDFNERICHIQNYIHPSDRDRFFSMLDRAEADRLNGVSDMVSVYRPDGSLGRYMLHIYFMETVKGERHYYCSLQDITEVTALQGQMRLLSRFSSDSIIFMRSRSGHVSFQVAVNGLQEVLGLSTAEFEAELNSLAFMGRVVEEDRASLRCLSVSTATEGRDFQFPFRLKNARDEVVSLYLKTDYVHDENTDVEYIISIRRREAV